MKITVNATATTFAAIAAAARPAACAVSELRRASKRPAPFVAASAAAPSVPVRSTRTVTVADPVTTLLRMPSRILVVLGLVVVVLAIAGAPAWAQSAGDEQYDDPFAGQQDKGSSAQPAPTAAPAPAAAAPAAAQAPAAPAAAPAASAAQLPRTGAETLLTALAGVGLVMAGVGLRLRLPADGG